MKDVVMKTTVAETDPHLGARAVSAFPLAPADAASEAALSVAVLVPCYNEAISVADVVRGMQAALPDAVVYVYDNNSSDGTSEAARQAGAVVRVERKQGKGSVVRRMFSDIEADVYLMVDGDGTYDAAAAPRLIAELLAGPYDLVNGARVHRAVDAYRPGHVFGNKMLTGLVATLFKAEGSDMLSGYKAMSRRFVKSFPIRSAGFEIETELLIHAVELKVAVSEVKTDYGERPAGSASKLNTIRDGLRILRLIAHMVKKERPMQFFSGVGAVFLIASVILGTSVGLEYLETGLVPRLPTAVLSVGLGLTSVLFFFTALILDTVTAIGRENRVLAFLSHPAAGAHAPTSQPRVRPRSRLVPPAN